MMCEFHESTCNGFGDIWWTDNPIYFNSIDKFNSPSIEILIMILQYSDMYKSW